MTDLNIPELIRTNQYFQYESFIMNYEDTLQKIFVSNKKSKLVDNNFIYLWPISENINNDIFPKLTNFDISHFDLNIKMPNDVVIMGPYIRNHIINNSDSGKHKIRNEIYLFRFCNNEWNDIIDLNKFENKKNEFTYEHDNLKFFVIKKKYQSPAHIILQHDYLKRCGWINGKFYVSSMFMIEFQKHKKLLNIDFKDPILGVPYDPLDVYKNDDINKLHPVKIISIVDYDELTKISEKHITKLYNSKTCLELCLDKFISENNPIIINQLKHMIMYLCGFKYKRHPILYAKLLGININIPELYRLLETIEGYYKIDYNEEIFYEISDINNFIIEQLIKNDNIDDLLDFLDYTKLQINTYIINKIIEYNSINIALSIITNKLLDYDNNDTDNHLAYYLILMMDDADLINCMNSFNIDIAMNYITDILENGKTRSFYILYNNTGTDDNSILNMKFDSNMNLLHKIKQNGNYEDIIKMIMKLNSDLINMYDDNKETPLLYHAKHNPQLLEYFINYEFDETMIDGYGNTILHNLAKHKNTDILKHYIKRCSKLINLPNKNYETPIMISVKNGNEDVFYLLKTFGANLDSVDEYGNTIYHYICSNSMCLGMMIKNTENHFGMKPIDYCKISSKYYNFI